MIIIMMLVIYIVVSTAVVTPDQAELEEYFSDLSDRTFDIIQQKNISVETFKVRLSNLPVRNKQQHRDFLSALFSKMDDSTLGNIWGKLNLYWNFLNFSLLDNLVKKFGDKNLIADFANFKKQLRRFRCKTRLCDFNLKEINESLSKEDLELVVFKLGKHWDECTLQDLENSRERIAQKLFIPSYECLLIDAKPGSISITWAIPTTIAVLLESMGRADIEQFCRTQRIVSIIVNSREFEYSSDEVYSGKEELGNIPLCSLSNVL